MAETTPDLLVAGDVILNGKGQEWTVDDVLHPSHEDGPAVVLEREGKVHTIPLAKLPERITLVSTAAQVEERAVALAQVRLGGEVVGVKDGGPFDVPLSFQDPGSMLAHLYLFHQAATTKEAPAVYPPGPMGELVRLHDLEHERTLVVPHVHRESFYRDLARADGPAGTGA